MVSSPVQCIKELTSTAKELKVLRRTIYLNLFCLGASDVNLLLAKRAEKLCKRLTSFLIAQNRDLNKE